MLTKFKMLVMLHIIILVGVVILSFYLITVQNILPFAAVLAVLLAITVISLFRLVNRTNHRLASFLMSIRYDDFDVTYSNYTSEVSEKELFGAFNLINNKFRDIRLEKEIQFQYFQTLVEQVETGLIGFDETGDTIFMNRALKNLVHKSYFPSLDSIRKFDADLHQKMTQLIPGQRVMFKRHYLTETIQAALTKTEIRVKNRTLSFYAFRNIHAELQEHEMRSWHKLIRILTHEIMNSVSPIVSLSQATDELLDKPGPIDEDTRSDVHQAIKAIEKRSEGLMHFTQTYRKLTRVPEPQKQRVMVNELIDRVVVLMSPEIKRRGIDISCQVATRQLACMVDPELMEQALINLLKNAMDALHGLPDGHIAILVESSGEGCAIRISDNGPGIPDEILEQIFVPFFTTKRDGSGIGLSLTSKIIQSHGGTISVFSNEGKGTEFIVTV